MPIVAEGGVTASPVVADGIAYTQDSASGVQAIELESGEVLWETSYQSPTAGTNGVVVVNDRIYGAAGADAFALDRNTGEEIWSTTLGRDGSEQIAMAPGYRQGLVYVSTVPVNEKGGEVGVLWALDGETGKKAWRFDTVPKDLWGNRKVNFGGGLGQPPAFDEKGAMYFGVGNPGPAPGTKRHPWGSSRPGPNLYTDSIVKLDAETGKLLWHYQVTPHDICNWDIGSPVLANVGGRSLVIAAGRSGLVVALDRRTGQLVWKQAVGRHNGHDKDGIHAMRGEFDKLETPLTVYPSALGGVYAPISVSGSRVVVPVVNFGGTVASQTRQLWRGTPTGELVGLDLTTGRVAWKHKFSSGAFGAPVSVNDLVFATSSDGTIYGFDLESGREVWKTSMPAGIAAGLTISGDTLLAPAGRVEFEGQTPQILAYRLSN